MEITVANIPDAGQEIRFDETAEWALPLASNVVNGTATSCSGQLLFERQGRIVRVTGSVTTHSRCVCERCGEEVDMSLSAPASLSYRPSGHADRSSESELSQVDLDVGWYEGGNIRLADVVSEALALALPDRMVCLEVEGCDVRTAALLASARIETAPGHPGFAALKDL